MSEVKIDIIPKPKEVKEKQGEFQLPYNSYIVTAGRAAESMLFAAKQLQECVQEQLGMKISITAGNEQPGDCVLKVVSSMKEESYELFITEEKIEIRGAEGAGIFYGVQTLCQIIEQCGGIIPCMEIKDEPDIPNRGYYFDQTRGRVLTLAKLKEIVDRMCRYKLNQLQLYVEHTYLFRDLSEMWRDQTPLTSEEIMELDHYCTQRHVELVPSLASFGHLYMLLSTKTYGHLCELEDSWTTPFSFWDRMRYHTINVTDDGSLALVKQMIQEYMCLFTSDKFNICADETFCLGKGKSAQLAEQVGVHRMYIDFLKELCSFLVEHDKTPMFWGDIIWKSPELMKELPANTVCLNWGYAPEQRENETQAIAKTGAIQYLCPGVAGWNQWVNFIENSYKNISLMAGYARKYHAIGILNTDWGDFGHVNDPEFSVPGMIYGAACSWSPEELSFEEMNRQISCVEYGDTTGTYVANLAQVCETSVFQWREAVLFYENRKLNQELEEGENLFRDVTPEAVEQAKTKRKRIYRALSIGIHKMNRTDRKNLMLISVTMDGIEIWNRIGILAKAVDNSEDVDWNCGYELAERLEKWFMAYKDQWRASSKEGDLSHLAEIVFWYADWMRGKVSI